MIKRWRADVDSTLGDVLTRVFRDPAALGEGRVFVERVRVTDARHRVGAGALVEVGSAQAAAAPTLEILHEDAGLMVVAKPAGLVTVPDHHGHDSLQARVALHLGCPLEQVHPTSRLDRGVSGVVVFALDRAARERLASARERGDYARHYLAIAARGPTPEHGRWSAPIGRDRSDPRKRAVNGDRSTYASTEYRTLARARDGALMRLSPETGRTHQLRVHAAHAGLPLDGDATYGGRSRLISATGDVLTLDRVALHAYRVELPGRRGTLRFVASVPEALRALWRAIGGLDEVWAEPTDRAERRGQ